MSLAKPSVLKYFATPRFNFFPLAQQSKHKQTKALGAQRVHETRLSYVSQEETDIYYFKKMAGWNPI